MANNKDLAGELNRLAGTAGLDAQGAANAWAGTTNLDILAALARVAGDEPAYLELSGVCNEIAGTTGLEAVGALQTITTGGAADPFTTRFGSRF